MVYLTCLLIQLYSIKLALQMYTILQGVASVSKELISALSRYAQSCL